MFVWIFHRITGVLLIVLLAMQLTTGYFQTSTSSSDAVRVMADLHRHAVVNCLLVFLVVFHGLYGLRTILLDLGMRREKLLFWLSTGLGIVLFVIFVVLTVSRTPV